MSDARPSNGSGSRSWFERLTKVLTGEPQDQQALIDLLRAAERRNLLHADALPMIEGALQVSDIQVRDIMVPRVQMVVVKQDAKPQDFLPIVIESGHSRFPVIGDDVDEVVGILLAKDLLVYLAKRDEEAFDIRDVMRPAVFVPESKRLNVLLREFRASRNHMAIVVDEYSGVSGLVTIEDVIEEIIGEIKDEHDIDEEDFIKQHGKNRYTVKALTPIEDFNRYFHTNFSDEEYDTFGGLMLNAFGRLPRRGETIDYGGFNVKVLRADKRRIHLMRLIRLESENATEKAS